MRASTSGRSSRTRSKKVAVVDSMRPPKEGGGVVPTGPAEPFGRGTASGGQGFADDRDVGGFVAPAAVRGGREIGGIGLREQPVEWQDGCQAAELSGGGVG